MVISLQQHMSDLTAATQRVDSLENVVAMHQGETRGGFHRQSSEITRIGEDTAQRIAASVQKEDSSSIAFTNELNKSRIELDNKQLKDAEVQAYLTELRTVRPDEGSRVLASFNTVDNEINEM